MKNHLVVLFAGLAAALPALAVEVAPVADQIASSVLAAPIERRADATVLGYNEKGAVVTLRKGTNEMVCLADDPNDKTFSVACYHKDLEPFMARGRELAKNVKGKERHEARWKEVDEGKLKLDDPVAKYLPEFNNLWLAAEHDNDHMLLKRPRHPITVREILSHTSGMGFSSAMEQPTLDMLPLRDAVRSYAMTPLQYEPGTKYQYANAGINTAGRLIEVLSGMPYAEFLNTRLFKPLGMKDTTFWPTKAQLTRLAKSYTANANKTEMEETTVTQLRYPLDDHTRQPMPAGGLFSTAGDLAHFCQMILNNGTYKGKRYLSEDAVKQMTHKQTGDALPDGYGLGWSTGGGNFGHGGAYSTNMNIDTNRGLITIWMVQHAGFPGNGGQSAGAFRKAAEEQFGSAHK